ncbi:MAG: transporter substrate-binding domain-containing protein [Coriobacteriia bacterium]|nr:transporter substrate-binding domain-containing protein [Coriobacteriia bacterium]
MTKVKKNILRIVVLATFMSLIVVLCSCSSNYKPELKNAQINTPNIIQSGTLKVGVDADNPPLAGETSKMSGIDVDVAYAIGDGLGLNVEIQDVGTNGAKALKDKKVDIVMGVDKSATLANCWKSEKYVDTASALFAKSANAPLPKKGDGKKVGAQMASSGALAAQNQLDVSNIKLESNLTACFDSLNNNRVDYVAADAVVGTYIANNSDVSCYLIGLLSNPSGYCVGVYESNVLLQTKIAVILEQLKKNGTFGVIESKYLAKNLLLDAVPKTEGAGNQANMSDVEGAVYDHTNTQ